MTDEQLRELGKQLPWERPAVERREALRSSLLVAATTETRAPRRRWAFLGTGFAAGVLAAATIAIVVTRAPSPTTAPEAVAMRTAHARIDAPSTAKLDHVVTATDEVVRVRTGIVKITVPPTPERVRAQTGDAEIEATGTYEVAVVDDRLERITVADGTARVIVRGEPRPIFLSAGQSWAAKPVIAEPYVVAVSPPAPPPPATKPKTAPAEKTPTEQYFERGWALLKEGKTADAAVELGRAADAGGELAEDARYWQAVAFVRSSQPAEAERTLVRFLDGAPTSQRRGRAAVLLGKLLRDRGDLQAARRWFETALADPDPAIAATAKAHLDAL